jgi:diaminopimelate decarboxylase
MAGFERVGGELRCDGVRLADVAQRHGTPLFVYSRAAIEEAWRGYETAFAAVPHRICYAVKANGNGRILGLLAGLGAGADIVSGGEMQAALRAGFAPGHVVFAGVGKTDDELSLGLELGIGEFNVESEEEIRRLGSAATARGRVARISLRVNPDIDPRTHPYISTGLREAKFGVPIARAPEILRRAGETPGVRVVGLQCHLGSQITDLAPLGAAARDLAALSRRLMAEGFALETIDLGGGLGVDYEEGAGPAPAALAAQILPALEGLPLTLVLEPGRSLVAGAGILLARVLYVKENGDRRFVIVDAGMNDLLRPALYGAFHRVEPVRSRGADPIEADVVGPVCETGDFLARGRRIERPEPGDLIAVRDTGAYGFAMSSRYNMRPRAAEVLVEDGEARLIRRRETFEDMIDTEV